MKKINKIFFSFILTLITIIGLASCDVSSLKKTYEVNLNVDLNNKIDLKAYYPNSGMSNSQFSNGWITQYFEKATGYKVTYEQDLGDQTTTARNILMGEQDYHVMKLESGTYMALVSEGDFGNFVDLKPVLEKFGQNLLETIPQEAWDAVTIDGKIFAIPEIGFGQMISSALVWNVEQLNAVGITKIPETLTEVNDALFALQEHFGATNGQYHAFAMQSAQAYIEPLAAAFGLNKDFYEDENGNVSHVMYHPNYEKYMKWLNSLTVNQILSLEWEGYTGANIVQNFAKGNLGCGYIPYWNVPSVIESLAASKGISSEEAKDLISWGLKVKGDGSFGSEVQETAKTLYYNSIGYYIAVPIHMAEYAAYVIDWANQRITSEVFEGYRLGEEGTHFEYTNANDPKALAVKIAGEQKYVKLLDKYETDILPGSMYQLGVNPSVAKELWILSEQSYDCWKILIDTDYDNIVGNAIEMAPYIKGWSEIDISSRSWVLTYEQKLINANSEAKFTNVLTSLRNTWKKNHWTEEVDSSVQNWYKNK